MIFPAWKQANIFLQLIIRDDKYEADQIDISVTVRAKGNSHNQSDVSPGIDIGSKVTGNPILALLLTLIAVGLSSARKSKK